MGGNDEECQGVGLRGEEEGLHMVAKGSIDGQDG